MIKIRNLKKRFGEREVLKGVNLDIKAQKSTVVLGVSGGGKSTIIKHIVGLLSADSGDIFVDGENITKMSNQELLRKRKDLGFLFQSGALFDSMNIFDNIAFPLREHTDLSEFEIKKDVERLLKMVALKPENVMHLFPDELSGGMKKRAGLARTLALKPKILLYDEPTSGLDPITSDLISQLIVKLQKELGTTSILITHDMREAFKCGDYFAMLYDGEIVEYGDKASFKNSKLEIVQEFISFED